MSVEIIQARDMDSAADLTLPLFTYVVLKARTAGLYGNYYYVKSFRYRERREVRDPVEFRYTFTTLKIALNFISELQPERLNLKPGDYFSSPSLNNAAIQTEPQPLPPFSLYKGPTDAEYLRNHQSELIELLDDYRNLRDCYLQKTGRLVLI